MLIAYFFFLYFNIFSFYVLIWVYWYFFITSLKVYIHKYSSTFTDIALVILFSASDWKTLNYTLVKKKTTKKKE